MSERAKFIDACFTSVDMEFDDLIRPPYSNGSEFHSWLESNCDKCAKFKPMEGEVWPEQDCEIVEAILDSMASQLVSPDIYKRMGGKTFRCAEWQIKPEDFIDPNQSELELSDE